jgi:hypothetical protein
MRGRRIHRILGLALLLPILGWAATGLVFFLKPGYEAAYARLPLKTYPLDQSVTIAENRAWEEVRLVKTILGLHLLVRSNGSLEQVDARTAAARAFPSRAEFEALVSDAIASNTERYGVVEEVNENHITTSTGVQITLDWNSLTLSQRGSDRVLIDSLYKVHYLQWTPWSGVNQVLGVVGLFLLFSLAVLGVRIYVRG